MYYCRRVHVYEIGFGRETTAETSVCNIILDISCEQTRAVAERTDASIYMYIIFFNRR